MIKKKPYLQQAKLALTNRAALQNDHAQWFPVTLFLEIEQQIPLQHEIASLPVLIDLPPLQKRSLSINWRRRCKHTQILLVYFHCVCLRKISVSCESKSKTISFIHNIQLFVRPRYRRRIVNKRNRKLQSQVITHSRKMNWWNVSCVKTPHQTHYSNKNHSVYTPNWTSVDYPNAMRLCKKLFISFSTADIISITFLTNKVDLL